ncbi:hypothetical protein DdX_16545 [Ditylenchus destructor]|uniref:Uncharacterized protein n=1 Tax=Ditylenchus destructor TaxID=166010 RepID=A0AAD4MTE4_9BILA|nr:hypothetical protein DdX_16545 [Ditylenchus destructor]
MKLILCVVAASILVSIVNSENNLQGVLTTVEDIKSEANASENLPSHNLNADAAEMKPEMESTGRVSLTKKVSDHPQLLSSQDLNSQLLFPTNLNADAAEIATDAAKIVEILNASLKNNEQQSIGENKGITEAEKDMSEEKVKFVEKSKEVITTHGAQPYHKKGTPKQKLIFVQEKLNEVTTTLEDIKTEASSSEDLPRYISVTLLSAGIVTHCHNALKYAGLLGKALDEALKVEEKAIGITNLNNLAGELRGTIQNIANNVHHANDPKNAKTLQQTAFRAVGEIITTLKDLEADLSDLNGSLKINEQQSIDGGKGITEAEKGTSKQKLIFVKEKLNEITTTLGDIKTKASPSDNLSRHITLTLKYAGLLSKALEAALQIEEKSVDIKNLRNFAGELQETIKNIGNNTGHGKHSEKAKNLQQSALRAVGEISTTLKDLEADLRKH